MVFNDEDFICFYCPKAIQIKYSLRNVRIKLLNKTHKIQNVLNYVFAEKNERTHNENGSGIK